MQHRLLRLERWRLPWGSQKLGTGWSALSMSPQWSLTKTTKATVVHRPWCCLAPAHQVLRRGPILPRPSLCNGLAPRKVFQRLPLAWGEDHSALAQCCTTLNNVQLTVATFAEICKQGPKTHNMLAHNRGKQRQPTCCHRRRDQSRRCLALVGFIPLPNWRQPWELLTRSSDNAYTLTIWQGVTGNTEDAPLAGQSLRQHAKGLIAVPCIVPCWVCPLLLEVHCYVNIITL